MKSTLRLFQAVLILASLSLFIFLGWKEFAPTGRLSISKSVDEASPFFSRILPDERTEEVYFDELGLPLQPIVGDPTYFTLTPPRDFDSVDFEIDFKNYSAPIVELGVLTNANSDAYALVPLQNKILDKLDWKEFREDGVALYDRSGKYNSVADFLVDTPSLEEIASYHYQMDRPYRITGYVPSSTSRAVEVSLRGEHEFLTYVQDETLSFTFKFMDMNRTLGEDVLEVLVFDERGEVVASGSADDDGNVSADGVGSEARAISINSKLSDGVYKFVLKTNRDIFFREITTSQQKLTFTNQLFLGDEVGYLPSPRAVSFVTEAKNISLETQHAEGVQVVSAAGVSIFIEEPFVQERHNVRAPGLADVMVPKGDLLIRGAGHYAFSRDMYFNPDPVRLEWNTDLDALGINYVIANYSEPEVIDEFVSAKVSFDIADLPRVKGAWKFVISIPGIYEHDGLIELSEITSLLHRAPISSSDLIKKLGHKIIGILNF